MRPPSAQNQHFGSLETFMAAHSPRKVSQTKQGYILKPLSVDKNKLTGSGFSRLLDGQFPQVCSPPPTITSKDWIGPLTNTSRSSSASGGKVSPINNKGQTQRDSLASSVPMLDLSKCRINNEDIIVKSASTFNGFRPSGYRTPKTPRPPSYSNTGQEAPELVAMGTMALTTQKQVHQPPSKPVPRFKSRTSTNNKEKDNFRYIDPMAGASPSFQSRVTEIAQLEVETIRAEKQRKTKKRNSSYS